MLDNRREAFQTVSAQKFRDFNPSKPPPPLPHPPPTTTLPTPTPLPFPPQEHLVCLVRLKSLNQPRKTLTKILTNSFTCQLLFYIVDNCSQQVFAFLQIYLFVLTFKQNGIVSQFGKNAKYFYIFISFFIPTFLCNMVLNYCEPYLDHCSGI